MTKLDAVDYTVIAFYFLVVLTTAVLSTFIKRSRKTTEGYFLAGKNVSWWGVGASLFASNIGSFHFIGLAGSGAAVGVAVISYEWSAVWILFLLGWYFVPVYLKATVFTLPEFIDKRFNSKILRIYLSVLALFLYCFTKISVDLYSGAIVFQATFEINFYISTLILLGITGAYTVFGGLTAVIYTEVIQTILMVGGALVLSVISLMRVGGFSALFQKFPETFNNSFPNRTFNTCFDANQSFHIFRPLSDPQFPWLGLLFGLPISGVWYWCADQVEVQRVLSASSKEHAQGGTILAGFLKLSILLLIVFPGMASRILFTNEVACKDCSNKAYILLILNLMPTALRGLMVAVVIAALMSSIASTLNSSSTLITIDVWKHIRPKAGNKELIIVGQIVVVLVMVVSVGWLPVIQLEENGQLFVYIQIISAYLTPPIAATFIIAITWRRANKWGAMVGLGVGLILGVTKLILDLVYGVPDILACEKDDRPGFVSINYLYFAIILLFISTVPNIIISLLTPKVDIKDLDKFVFNWRDLMPYKEIFSKSLIGAKTGSGKRYYVQYSKPSSESSDRFNQSPLHKQQQNNIDSITEVDALVDNNALADDNAIVDDNALADNDAKDDDNALADNSAKDDALADNDEGEVNDSVTLIPGQPPVQFGERNRYTLFCEKVRAFLMGFNIIEIIEFSVERKFGLKTVYIFKISLLYTFAVILMISCATLYALYL